MELLDFLEYYFIALMMTVLSLDVNDKYPWCMTILHIFSECLFDSILNHQRYNNFFSYFQFKMEKMTRHLTHFIYAQ